MEDRHAQQISSAIRAVASALSWVGFAIIMGACYVQCAIMSHH